MHIAHYSEPSVLSDLEEELFGVGILATGSLWADQTGESLCSSFWASLYRTCCAKCALHFSWKTWHCLEPLAEKKKQVKLEVDLWGFGAGIVKDWKPTTLWLKKRYQQRMRGFELLQKFWVQKHSSSWHHNCLYYTGCLKETSHLHITQSM